jgi:tetratricopeptide (TPR) repeat protein
MRFSLRLRASYCLFLCIVTLAGDGWAAEPQWLEVRSPHFSVYTDAGEKRGRETALEFEKMRALFATLLGTTTTTFPDAPQIVAFRSAEEMRQFAPLWNGKPATIAGFFQESDERSYIVIDLSAADPWRVVLHEYGHFLLTRSSTRRFEPWFAEGFAGYFSTLESDKKESRIGEISEQDLETLQRDGTFKIADLFRIRQSSRTYNESGDRRSVFYAESNLVVHYLYDNSLIPAVFKYFDLVTEKQMPVEEAMRQAFGMTAEEFDKAFRSYVNAGRFRTYSLPRSQSVERDQFTVRVPSQPEQMFLLADIHLHSPDYEQKGLEELRQLVQTMPGDALALRELGNVHLRQKNYAEAHEYLRRAVLENPRDSRAHYYSALLMSREKGFSNLADLAAMKKELEASIALDADLADAHSLLAFVQTFSADTTAGIESMRRAVALKPGEVVFRFNLAQLYLHNRMPDSAIELLKAIDSSGNAFLNKRIADALKDALEMKVASAGGKVSVPGFLMLTP